MLAQELAITLVQKQFQHAFITQEQDTFGLMILAKAIVTIIVLVQVQLRTELAHQDLVVADQHFQAHGQFVFHAHEKLS